MSILKVLKYTQSIETHARTHARTHTCIYTYIYMDKYTNIHWNYTKKNAYF